jgi:hypothetical protein
MNCIANGLRAMQTGGATAASATTQLNPRIKFGRPGGPDWPARSRSASAPSATTMKQKNGGIAK